MDAIAAWTSASGARGIIVTSPPEQGAPYDFVSRYFSPADGIPEDPVTGSAHTALADYWGRRLGRDRMRAHQASSRGGDLLVELRGDRVDLTGGAVTVLEGTLLV